MVNPTDAVEGSVNEVSLPNTGMVRIADAIDNNDVCRSLFKQFIQIST